MEPFFGKIDNNNNNIYICNFSKNTCSTGYIMASWYYSWKSEVAGHFVIDILCCVHATVVMDVNRLAKPPNEGLSDDEAKGSGNENDSIKIHPITYRDVQSATEKIYNGGINKTNLQVSPTRGEIYAHTPDTPF